ncbi:MAG: hypothetical protein AAFQ94_31500 [Bacteroidota bacterium]
MIVTIITFAIAASIGLTMIIQVFKNKKPLKAVAISHGMFAATSLVFLVLESIKNRDMSVVSLIFFLIAASVGFFMFYKDFFDKNRELVASAIPKPVAFIHAASAIVGFVLLVVVYFL